jgi:hypothetical protein
MLGGLVAGPVAPSSAHLKLVSKPPQPTNTFVLIARSTNQPVDWLTWCGDCVGVDYTTANPWVTNPTTCLWDSDDEYSYSYDGTTMAAGASASVHECEYGSPRTHRTDTQFSASSPSLVVTQSFAWDNGTKTQTWHVAAVLDPITRLYDYNSCFHTPNGDPTSDVFVTVPGSNGGVAMPVAITTTVTNPTSTKVSKIGGKFEGGNLNSNFAGCDSNMMISETSSNQSAPAGTTVTFSAKVSIWDSQPSPTPTGTVNFYDAGASYNGTQTLLGSSTLNSSGVATFSTASLSVGTHYIYTEYFGDGRHIPAFAGPLIQAIT